MPPHKDGAHRKMCAFFVALNRTKSERVVKNIFTICKYHCSVAVVEYKSSEMIYCATDADPRGPIDFVKIGFTEADEFCKRRKNLNTGNKDYLSLIGSYHGDRKEDSRVKNLFAPFNVQRGGGREWFFAVPSIFKHFEVNAIKGDSPCERASSFLQNIFADGKPILGIEVMEQAKNNNITETTLRRWADRLNIKKAATVGSAAQNFGFRHSNGPYCPDTRGTQNAHKSLLVPPEP